MVFPPPLLRCPNPLWYLADHRRPHRGKFVEPNPEKGDTPALSALAGWNVCSVSKNSPSEISLSFKQAKPSSFFSCAEQLRHGGVSLPGAGRPAVIAESPDLQDRALPQHREAPFGQTAENRQLK